MKDNASDRVRNYVRDHYILPARKVGATAITVRVGEVHKALGWDLKRVPQVCSALSTRKFLVSANVELLERKGPPSGQSTTVEFTFKLLGPDETPASSPRQAGESREKVADGSGLLDLMGILKEEFRALGGGDAYLKAERASWGPDPWERYEKELHESNEGSH